MDDRMIIQVWFYINLIKKGVMEQLPCDKIFFERRLVRLCDDCTRKMENGIYVVKYLEILRKRIVKKLPLKVQQLYMLDPIMSVLPDTKNIDNEKNWL